MKHFGIYSTIILCSGMMFSQARAEEHQHHHHVQSSAPEAKETPLSDESVYNLNSELLDKDGKKVKLTMFRGQAVVISMAYTSCVHTCPLILSQMQQIEKKLSETGKKGVRFVLVSFDPVKDTPDALKDYAKKKNLSSQWELLTSKSDKAPREIASVLGIKYSKVKGGEYDHSFILTVLDKEGVPRGRQVGANSDPKDLIKYIP